MNDSQFLKPNIVLHPPAPPIRTSFGSYRLVLPFDVGGTDKPGMIWLRRSKVGGETVIVPEYITHAVVYPIAGYVEKDTKGNWQHSTLWHVHPVGQTACHDVRLSDSIVVSNAAVRKFGAHGAHVVESRHFSKFTEFLRCQLIHFKGITELIRIA